MPPCALESVKDLWPWWVFVGQASVAERTNYILKSQSMAHLHNPHNPVQTQLPFVILWKREGTVLGDWPFPLWSPHAISAALILVLIQGWNGGTEVQPATHASLRL